MHIQLDARNRTLQASMLANVHARDAADAECTRLLDVLDEVRPLLPLPSFPSAHIQYILMMRERRVVVVWQAYAKWNELPMDEIQSWALQTAEAMHTSSLR